jgi:hypothetical protein
MLDSDELGSTEAGRDPLDDSWDAPDRPSTTVRFPTTPREEREGPTFDRLLAAELPDADPYLEAERRESGPILDADVYGEGTTALTLEDEEDLIARESPNGRDTDNWADPAEESALHLE